MTKYLAGVLSVIAVGTMLIAYALLKPAAPVVSAFDGRALDAYGRPLLAGARVPLPDDYGAYGFPAAASYAGYGVARAYPAAYPAEYPAANYPAPSRPALTAPAAPRRTATRSVERSPRRDWKKTALVIGGSTAGGAGLGAIFGGKKGALIGAAIGGGASTIYEATKR
jgi:hypothetical protein